MLCAGSNAAARRWLDHPHDWPSGRLALWGEPGCGKTLLAELWAGPTALWCDGPHLAAMPEPARAARVVVDNAESCADEQVLLHLINTCAETGRLLLLTGRAPPARWPARLPDLSSRLRATQAAGIDPPEDELLRALLARQLAARQLAIPAAVQEWLLLRLPRSAEAVQTAVDRLDRHSLARHQPITRALARAAIPDLLTPDLLAGEPGEAEAYDDGSMNHDR